MYKLLYNPFRVFIEPNYISQYNFNEPKCTGIYHHINISEIPKDEYLVAIWHIKYKQ